MPAEQGLAAGTNPSWTLAFWNRVHRYRCLLVKFWWIAAFLLSACLCVAAYSLATTQAAYRSTASLIIEPKKFVVKTGDNNTEASGEGDVANQIIIMKSGAVGQRTDKQLLTEFPDVGSKILRDGVRVDYTAQNTIIFLNATASSALDAQRYLEAHLKGYFDYRRGIKGVDITDAVEKVQAQINSIEKELAKDDADINEFQRNKGVVLSGAGGEAGVALADLRKRLSDLRTEQDKLTITTPEEALTNPIRHGGEAVSPGNANSRQQESSFESSSASADYRAALQAMANAKVQLDDLSRDLRPKHPKIERLNADIRRQQGIIETLKKQNREESKNRLATVDSLIKTTEQQVETAKGSTLDTDQIRNEYNQLVARKDRHLKAYSELQNNLQQAALSRNIDQEAVHIIEHASPGQLIPTGYAKTIAVAILAGLAMSIGILLLIDRMDDRMNSISDFQLHFAEHVIGQIPRDAEAEAGANTELLRPDDQRHQLVESFRNLRSTLLFMPLDGVRPKTLLITSAVPNEGKSTVSSNLALVLASAGMKTLLIDADLRRGAIHHAFGLTRDPGLTDVLGHSVNWKLAIRDTGVENLHVLPRGRNVPQPSEYLLNRSTDLLLKELYPLYDYIIIDSSPVLAADDTASLAPKIDATLFVVRLSFTSAKMTRKSLEILYKRQANIPGLILNQVDTSSPDFVYYQYSEYYNAATDDEPVKVKG